MPIDKASYIGVRTLLTTADADGPHVVGRKTLVEFFHDDLKKESGWEEQLMSWMLFLSVLG